MVIVVMNAMGRAVPVPSAQSHVWLMLALFALSVLAANLALQYGATRLPANTLSVIMISEVLFAAVSTILAGESSLTRWTLLGGALIVSASLLAIFSPQPVESPSNTERT
jgi:drug/metabolite transporter (DMT)-like permease